MWGIIGTWEMVKEGVVAGGTMLDAGRGVLDACEKCVNIVEANPDFSSVGKGGLPNAAGVVEVDAAVMEGRNLNIGAVMGIRDFLHPASIARSLKDMAFNNVLCGSGAESYAEAQGFERHALLTPKSYEKWQRHHQAVEDGLSPYIGHDTVCAIGLDRAGHMATVTSTSGLFYKQPGRVGDSPIPGSGYYVDDEIGGAAATGLGEDIMKGSLSYAIVALMDQGLSPQAACEAAVSALDQKLKRRRGKAGDLSVVAMDCKGRFGAATNIERFPFYVMTSEKGLQKGLASYHDGQHTLEVNHA